MNLLKCLPFSVKVDAFDLLHVQLDRLCLLYLKVYFIIKVFAHVMVFINTSCFNIINMPFVIKVLHVIITVYFNTCR